MLVVNRKLGFVPLPLLDLEEDDADIRELLRVAERVQLKFKMENGDDDVSSS